MPWLIKSEPNVYSFSDLLRDTKTRWDGVRNFEARNNLRAMGEGDLLLFYHSNVGKEIVGVAKVVRTAYPDPKAKDWTAIDIGPVKALSLPVALDSIKGDRACAQMALLKKSRLSVQPVTEAEFAHILQLGKTRL